MTIACTKTTEQQMNQYIEFYYPTTGEATYEINFDWGYYSIITGAGNEEELSPASEPYRGYITLRPRPNNEEDFKNFSAYLITKNGEVWICKQANEIAPVKTREEIVVENQSTSTTTINSPLEAVVDHFNANPSKWESYGTLKKQGEDYSLELR